MKKVAQFFKISEKQFIKDFSVAFNNKYAKDEIIKIYENIKLPFRATKGSAGYDFFLPISFSLKPNESINIPTGICCKIDEGWVLKIYPRSGLGFKYRLQLNNSVGIIDSDYYYSSNEGHIFIKIINANKEDKVLNLKELEGFAQGIFVEYGITYDDCAKQIRDGGFGSTNKKQ